MRHEASKHKCLLAWIVLAFLGFPIDMDVAAAERGINPRGPWIIIEGRFAPWNPPGTAETLDESILLGNPVEFWPSEVSSPTVLGCREARYEKKDLPPEGLFQGLLPSPAAVAASGLGFSTFPVPTVRVTCATGVFDYHQLGPDKLLVAIDNIIWTLVPARSTP